jgi:hypothetical protein
MTLHIMMRSAITGWLADNTPHNTGPDFGKASPVGLLILVVLVIATFLLIRSMNRQLKKVPKSFDDQQPEPGQRADDSDDTEHPETRNEPGG